MLPAETRLEIGDRIRDYRQRNGISQQEFAETIDISVNFLSEIENGRKGMSFETLYTICKKYNIPSDLILFGPAPETKPSKTIIDTAQRLTSEELTLCINFLTALKEMKDI